MPSAKYTPEKGLWQEPGEDLEFAAQTKITSGGLLVTTGGMDVRNSIVLRTHEASGISEPSGSLFILRGRDEAMFFHMGGNQYISSNAWYDADATQWKFATGSGDHSAFRWGFIGKGRFDLDYVNNGSQEELAHFTASMSITSSNGYIGIGKTNPDADVNGSFNARLDVSGSHQKIALAVTGSVDLGGGAEDSFFALPRLTDAQRNALSAMAGMLIYNTTTNKLNFYNGSAWKAVDDSAI